MQIAHAQMQAAQQAYDNQAEPDAGDDCSAQMLGDVPCLVHFSNYGGVEVMGVTIGGEYADRDCFGLLQLQRWKQAIEAEQEADAAEFWESQQ